MLDVKVKGLSQLDATLKELPSKLAKNVARASLRAGCKVIAEEAGRRAPVKTGRLRDTIRVTSRIAQGQPSASVKVGDRKKGVFYAHMVEFGTAAHRIPGPLRINGRWHRGVQHPGAKRQPFLRPATDIAAQAAVEAFAAHMRKRFTKEGISTPDPEPETD